MWDALGCPTLWWRADHIEYSTGEMVVEGCKASSITTAIVRLSVGRFAVTVLGEKLELPLQRRKLHRGG